MKVVGKSGLRTQEQEPWLTRLLQGLLRASALSEALAFSNWEKSFAFLLAVWRKFSQALYFINSLRITQCSVAATGHQCGYINLNAKYIIQINKTAH